MIMILFMAYSIYIEGISNQSGAVPYVSILCSKGHTNLFWRNKVYSEVILMILHIFLMKNLQRIILSV